MLSNCGAGEDSWESLVSKEIKPVHPEENHLWIFTGRIDAETIAPILWPLDVKSRLTGKDPDAGKTEGRRSGRQRMRWLDSITDSMDMNLSKFLETVKDLEAWCAAIHVVPKSWTQLSDWTTATRRNRRVIQSVLGFPWIRSKHSACSATEILGLSLSQLSSKCSFRPVASASPGSLLEMQNLFLYPIIITRTYILTRSLGGWYTY